MRTGRRSTVPLAAVVLLALVGGCGSQDASPRSYPTSKTRISAQVGEKFTLTADELPGENWYLVTPKPDASVVRGAGDHYESDVDPKKLVGASSRHVFTFKATGAGRSEIILLHCPVTACTGGPDSPTASPKPSPSLSASLSPSASPSASVSQPAPERITYTVTVS